MQPADLTAIVFTNLLWFLFTLCLGTVHVTRPVRVRTVPAAQAEDVLAEDAFLAEDPFPAEDARPVTDVPLPSFGADEAPSPDEIETVTMVPSRGVFGGPASAPEDDEDTDILAPGEGVTERPLPPLVLRPAAGTGSGPAAWPLPGPSPIAPPARRARPAPRHARPRPPARLSQSARAAVFILVVILAMTGIGLGLGTGSAAAPAARIGGPAADFRGAHSLNVADQALPSGTTRRQASHSRQAARRGTALASRLAALRDRIQDAETQLQATLTMIRVVTTHRSNPTPQARHELLASLTRRSLRLRQEIARLKDELREAARRARTGRLRLDAARKPAPAGKPRPGHHVSHPGAPVTPAPTGEDGRRMAAVDYAEAQLGRPYEWGGAGPYAFDCSGLVMMAWQAGGISLPHYTVSQWDDTYHITGAQLRPGDLVFSYGFGHVQMYVGHGEVIQAPYTGAVVDYSPLPPPAEVDGYASVLPPVGPPLARHHPARRHHHPAGPHPVHRRPVRTHRPKPVRSHRPEPVRRRPVSRPRHHRPLGQGVREYPWQQPRQVVYAYLTRAKSTSPRPQASPGRSSPAPPASPAKGHHHVLRSRTVPRRHPVRRHHRPRARYRIRKRPRACMNGRGRCASGHRAGRRN